VTINNNTGHFMSGNWNEYNLNPLTRIHWRASLVDIQLMLLTPEIVGQLLFLQLLCLLVEQSFN
jgi:hypothetical protein